MSQPRTKTTSFSSYIACLVCWSSSRPSPTLSHNDNSKICSKNFIFIESSITNLNAKSYHHSDYDPISFPTTSANIRTYLRTPDGGRVSGYNKRNRIYCMNPPYVVRVVRWIPREGRRANTSLNEYIPRSLGEHSAGLRGLSRGRLTYPSNVFHWRGSGRGGGGRKYGWRSTYLDPDYALLCGRIHTHTHGY